MTYFNITTYIGAIHICNLLKVTTTLKVIKIDGNHIGDDGIFLVCEGLKENHTLTSLTARQCGFSVKGNVI